MHKPFYDPEKSYEENFKDGPFGPFADGSVHEERDAPTHSFLGLPVHTPFGIPAGPLINGAFVKAALDKGFDLPVYKTVRTRKYPSHPWPNVLAVHPGGDLTLARAAVGLVGDRDYAPPVSITNSFGVPSFNPDFWQPDLAAAVRHARDGQVVIASFQGTSRGDGDIAGYIEDFVFAARLLQETGVKALEVNLSCPNEGTSHLLCFDLDRTTRVAAAIKNEIGNLPLVLKIAYFESDAMLEALIRSVGPMVQGISSINTIAAEIRDSEGNQALPGEGRLRSGVCGHAIKWAGLEMTGRLKALREKLGLSFAIVGVGGVTTPEDYKEYRAAGADAAMSATGAMWDPYLAREIKRL